MANPPMTGVNELEIASRMPFSNRLNVIFSRFLLTFSVVALAFDT
ncbi:hypothetical protein LSEI_2876 [Lacticaseibacillus paracasei ATCC 334]|uniref:MFS transporter n=1 Tax=Lacticaseibacillus paracasei (strain ATCC 334 / BCRC 17002 / CCUG 31169 / CIP 107868 / KCTC 3260 / NRRL B-441) TaxID=321967 RepID=Q033N7_LACP3|nr:hypothetical protein LSEI_2876 [Lacticaseibacillus paracasei ATCC 334]